MLNYGKYLLPAFFSLVFVWLSPYSGSCLYFLGLLFVLNLIGNKVGGEFTNREILQEIIFFRLNPGARVVKIVSAFTLLGVLGWSLLFVDSGTLTIAELLGFSLMAGFISGCFTVTLAHDLLHAKSPVERSMANLLLVVACIPHFTNDHLLGHHRLIGLVEDQTTAKYGDSFYRYFLKAAWFRIKYSYFVSYNLPTKMCRTLKRQNITLALCVALIFVGILLVAQHPMTTLTFFAGQGVIAYVLYELINYIQHYGLQRTVQPNGKPESVQLRHAWNCYYKYSNYLLFLLPLHSAHHMHPHPRNGTNLMGPRLPYVYFVMVAMALVPPLWFQQMNPRVRRQWVAKPLVPELFTLFICFIPAVVCSY